MNEKGDWPRKEVLRRRRLGTSKCHVRFRSRQLRGGRSRTQPPPQRAPRRAPKPPVAGGGKRNPAPPDSSSWKICSEEIIDIEMVLLWEWASALGHLCSFWCAVATCKRDFRWEETGHGTVNFAHSSYFGATTELPKLKKKKRNRKMEHS